MDLDLIWDSLGHADRFVRYAARVALEWQPLTDWQVRALTDADVNRRILGAVALARAGSYQLANDTAGLARLEGDALGSLNGLDYGEMSIEQRRDLLRAYALVFIRLGKPSVQQAAEVIGRLEDHYPDSDDTVNRELARVLVYLNAPSVVQKTLALMEKEYPSPAAEIADLLNRNPGYGRTIAAMLGNHPEMQKLHYAFVLRNMRYGWTLDERRQYFAWLNRAKQRTGGASYEGFIENMRKDALSHLSEAEKQALASETVAPPPTDAELPKPIGPGHEWTVDEIVALAGNGLAARDFERGRQTFAASRCVICHRFDGQGGATGPDLTSVAGRFAIKDLAESLVFPSKVVSDQYRASLIHTLDGKVITGRIVNETDDELTVQTHPEDATQIAQIEKSNVESLEPSPTSLMPEKLLNVLNEQELLDLLAYLLSRGNPDDLMFQQAGP